MQSNKSTFLIVNKRRGRNGKKMNAILNLFICESWIYILSISLQVTGAICLIINYWGNVKKKVILTYYAGGEMPKAQDNNMVRLKKERLQSCAKDIYMNRCAFIYIVVGYGMGLFGELTENICKLHVLITIILFCIVFVCICFGISTFVAKRAYKKDIEVDRKIIEKITDVMWSDIEGIEAIDKLFENNL